MATNFTINGKPVSVEAPPETPLLWVVREGMKLTGTKFGCGTGLCGACMVHIDGKRAYSCQAQLSELSGKLVTTIEGLSPDGNHPVQKAWLAERVPQCGYCQSGQIMSAADLLKQKPKPTRDEIVEHMSTNLCRCGTYQRIVRAFAHHPEQRGLWGRLDRHGFAVDRKVYRHCFSSPSCPRGAHPQRFVGVSNIRAAVAAG